MVWKEGRVDCPLLVVAEDHTQDTLSKCSFLIRPALLSSNPLLCFFAVTVSELLITFSVLSFYRRLSHLFRKNRTSTSLVSSELQTNSFRICSEMFLSESRFLFWNSLRR